MLVTTEIPLPPYDTDTDTVPVCFCGEDLSDVWFDIFPNESRMAMHRTVLAVGGAFSPTALAAARVVGSSRFVGSDEHAEVLVWEIPAS